MDLFQAVSQVAWLHKMALFLSPIPSAHSDITVFRSLQPEILRARAHFLGPQPSVSERAPNHIYSSSLVQEAS